MDLKNKIFSFILMAILIFTLNIKITNAQSIAQSRISSVTNINTGTDRIVEIMQEDFDNDLIIENKDKTNESSEPDIEVFMPASTSENVENGSYDNKNIDNESNNNNISLKNENTSKHDIKTKIITSVSGSNIKVDTNRNGEVKNKIVGADVAVVRELNTSSGKLFIGGLIDYNHDNYENESNKMTGKGDSDAVSVGVIAKQIRDDGIYYEGSARLGRAKTDLNSNNFVINNQKSNINYEESAPIYAGHIKLGKVIKNNEKQQTDIYTMYTFAHQDNNTIRLQNNDKYNVGSIDSNRLKIGCRMTTKVKDGKIYYGLAYQYEGSAKVKSTNAASLETQVDNAKGSTGVLELGYKINASRDNTLNVDLNLTGFAGNQKGFTFQTQLIKSF